MTIYQYTDSAAEEVMRTFWSLVPVIAEQAAISQADVVLHLRRACADRIKAVKLTEGVDYSDDGRAVPWRVRLMLWRIGPQGQEDLIADSDPDAQFTQYDVAPGSTLIQGLPAVAVWVNELCVSAHPPGSVIEGLSVGILQHKIKSLRVSLSNSGGRSMWRIRYSVTPPAQLANAPASSNPLRDIARSGPALQHYRADVQVMREESPRHK